MQKADENSQYLEQLIINFVVCLVRNPRQFAFFSYFIFM